MSCKETIEYLDPLPDLNECADMNDRCNQNCTNTPGSYICSCFNGSRLLPDMETCDGEEATQHRTGAEAL